MVELVHPSHTETAPERFTLRISTERFHLILGVVLLRLLMDYSYAKYLSPENAAATNFTNSLNPEKLFESWVLMLACAAFLPTKARKPSDFLVFYFFLLPCMATISLFAFLDGSREYGYFAAASFIVVATTRNIKLTLPNLQIKGAFLWIVPACFIAVAAVGATYFAILGTTHFQFDLMEVYSVRGDIMEHVSQSWVLAYAGTWAWTVLSIALMAWSIQKRKWLTLILLLIMQVYFFGMSSQKAVLFFPILVFAAYAFAQPTRPLAWLLYGAAAVVAIGMLEEMTTGTFLWNHVLVRRALWDPARINWSYFELFSRIGHVYMSENLLKPLISYPFELPPAFMVGAFAYGHADADADTGILGTSYMHFGVAGMIAFAIATGLLLRLTDMMAHKRVSVWMATAIVIGPFSALFNDSDLPTTLLTHGLGLALCVLFLYGHIPAWRLNWLAKHPSRRGGSPIPAQGEPDFARHDQLS